MWDQALIISLNVQNLIVYNVANIPSCLSFSWWIEGQDCAMKLFIDILLPKYLMVIDLSVQSLHGKDD
jgi:hypothetical protein